MLRVSVFELALSGLSPITLTRNTFSQFSLKRSGQQCAFAGTTIGRHKTLGPRLRGDDAVLHARSAVSACATFPRPSPAARRIANAIARRKRFYVLPWPMAIGGRLFRALPRPLYDRVFANAPLKPRRPV
jgi:hypothetical protein